MPYLSVGPFRPAADHDRLYVDEDAWLLPGLIPTDGLVVLASAPKTGKTCLATAIARAVATDTPFAGIHPRKAGPVLWCAHEEGPRERKELHRGLTPEDPLLVAYPGELPSLDAPEPSRDRYGRPREEAQATYVFEWAAEVQAKLIIIDCLHAAVERGSLSENHFARRVMGRLKRLAAYFHVPVLVLHHLTKSATRGWHPERFADSAQILAAADAHFFMDRKESGSTGPVECIQDRPGPDDSLSVSHATPSQSHITLHGRGRHPAPLPRLDLLSTHPLHYEPIPETPEDPPSAAERIRNLHYRNPTMQPREIARNLGVDLQAVHVVLHRINKSSLSYHPKGEVK